MLTFEQFQATGKEVDNIGDVLGDADEELDRPGRVYDDAFWILPTSDGRWYLRVIQDEWTSADLTELERHLYDWYVQNV